MGHIPQDNRWVRDQASKYRGSKGAFYPCNDTGTPTFRHCQREIMTAGGYRRCFKKLTRKGKTLTTTPKRWAKSTKWTTCQIWQDSSNNLPTPTTTNAAVENKEW